MTLAFLLSLGEFVLTHLNSIGLAIDAIGFVMLLKFALPNKVIMDHVLEASYGPAVERRRERYRFFSNLGAFLVVLGFGLQIASNYL